MNTDSTQYVSANSAERFRTLGMKAFEWAPGENMDDKDESLTESIKMDITPAIIAQSLTTMSRAITSYIQGWETAKRRWLDQKYPEHKNFMSTICVEKDKEIFVKLVSVQPEIVSELFMNVTDTEAATPLIAGCRVLKAGFSLDQITDIETPSVIF